MSAGEEIAIPFDVLRLVSGMAVKDSDVLEIRFVRGFLEATLREKSMEWSHRFEVKGISENLMTKVYEFYPFTIRSLVKRLVESDAYKHPRAPIYFVVKTCSWAVSSGPLAGTIIDVIFDIGY